MRPFTRRALLVCAVLLASVATVRAGCAWVLWEAPPDSEIWRLAVSYASPVYETQLICENTATSRFNAQWQANFDARIQGRKEKPIPRYLCFPDTIDPRGPKGK